MTTLPVSMQAVVRRRGSIRAIALLQVALLLTGAAILLLRVIPHAWRSVNTDFPNYYVAARLVREGYPMDRIYEWEWFAKAKDRMGIDQPLAGFIPHTPLSILPMLPLARFDPLVAKRIWIFINLALVAASIAVLSRLTGLGWRWLSIAAMLSFPLYRNLEYGQYYILILFLLSLSLWAYESGKSSLAGVLLALAAALKIFPLLLVLFFLRKRDWRALAGFLLGVLAATLYSLSTFGKIATTRFVVEILPAALRGEAMDPYNLAANSISALLHHLFIYDPQLNLHPISHAPAALAILQPILQFAVLVPAVLLCSRDRSRERDRLEWSALLVATLAVSTLPASYHFIILLLPCALWCAYLRERAQFLSLALCVALYFLIGWPVWPHLDGAGLAALLAVPRLWAMLALTAFGYHLLRQTSLQSVRTQWRWAATFSVLCILQVVSGLRHQSGLYDSQLSQLPLPNGIFSAALPSVNDRSICFSAMTLDGWRPARLRKSDLQLELNQQEKACGSGAALGAGVLAESRDVKGRGSIWIVSGSRSQVNQVSGAELDVYDMAVTPARELVFSARTPDGRLSLFQTNNLIEVESLGISDARFPAVSPDGKWLAYSSLRKGTWHLMIRNLGTKTDRTLGRADCNQFSPAWESDSQTLVYASDCGRGLWQTALYRRTVLP